MITPRAASQEYHEVPGRVRGHLIALYHQHAQPDDLEQPDRHKRPARAVSGPNIRERRSCLMNREYHTAA
jgi:hypothetical protein